MKLKKLLKVCDDDFCFIIRQDDELDHHYAYASAIPYELLNLKVLGIYPTSLMHSTLLIHIALPEEIK